MSGWYYAERGAQLGPVPPEDLHAKISSREIDSQTLVWRAGMTSWQEVEKVDELRSLLPASPHPPPLPISAAPTPAAASPPLLPAALPSSRTPDPASSGKPLAKRALKEISLWAFGSWLWDYLKVKFGFDQPATTTRMVVIAITVSSLMSSTIVYFIITSRKSPASHQAVPGPEKPRGTGQILIDANPWGTIQEIRGEDGRKVSLNPERTTPYLMALPAGKYQAKVEAMGGGAAKQCDLQVQPDHLAKCWLNLAPVDAKSYFRTIGW